jgi:hypothetical protein
MKPLNLFNHVGQTRKRPDSASRPDRGNRGGFRAHSRTAVNWHVIIGWAIGPAVWLVIALVIFFCCSSCESKTTPKQSYNKDSVYACPPIDAPIIDHVRRYRSELVIYTGSFGLKDRFEVDLSEEQSDFVIKDCTGFVWDCKEYPFQFFRNVRGTECEEYIVYYGKRINVN